jgi:hypothetical protein
VVQPLPGDRPVQGANPGGGLPTPVRPTLLPSQVPLRCGQLACGCPEVPRVGDVFALAGSQEPGHPHVNAGNRARHRQGLQGYLHGDDNEPAGPPSRTLTLHTDLTQDGVLWEVAVKADLNMGDALDLESFRGRQGT